MEFYRVSVLLNSEYDGICYFCIATVTTSHEAPIRSSTNCAYGFL